MLTRGRRTTYAVTAVACALVGLTGCDTGGGFGTDGDGLSEAGAQARALVASTAYAQAHPDEAAARLGGLAAAVDRLRDETSSGWTGRQDDATGYLAELGGGRWFPAAGDDAAAAVTSLMDAYGPALFGIDADDLDLGPLSAPLATGTATLRATQRVGEVPVLDAALTVSIGAAADDPRVNAVRGRVFPDLDVTTTPSVGARRAGRIATRLSGGGTVQDRPTLYVVPTGTGDLAWEVPVMGVVSQGGSTGLAGSLYYVSATSGRLVSERPMGAELAPLTPGLEATPASRAKVSAFRVPTRALQGESVEVQGTGPTGEALTGHGVRTAAGVELIDTTVPGGIDVYDMRGSTDDSQLPGAPYVEQGTTIRDPDAIAAQAYTRMVRDYYLEQHGRDSWDGLGHRMTSSINYGDDTLCNAFFGLYAAQMFYGPPCAGPGGLGKLVTLDVTGHEVTHGVTGTSSGLIYFGQAGALNESFSDYFGNVIGDRHEGTDSTVLSEDLCSAVTRPQRLCKPMPDGSLALRNLLNGTTFDDYLRTLAPSLGLQLIVGYDTDNGGVHMNSAIWNNALWSIRTQVAQMDGVPAVESPRAEVLDQAVYLALTTRLTPQATFVDAASAVLASLTDVQAGAEILRVATQVFEQAGICATCAESVATPGTLVDSQPGRQVGPSVSGDVVTWLDVDDAGAYGTATSARFDGTSLDSGAQASTVGVALAGDAVVTADVQAGQILRYADSGVTALADLPAEDAAARGLVGGADGAAWVNVNDETLEFVDPAGTVSSTPLSGVAGDIWSVGTGGGTVVIGTDRGGVYRWVPGGSIEQLGTVDGQVLSLAAYADKVLAVTGSGLAVLFEGTEQRQLSDGAAPFGAALSADHAVWAEKVGSQQGAIAAAYADTPLAIDTDLFVYSFSTGHIYDLLPVTGQQGYPALSGDRIAWQDAVLGDDDVFTATIPDGL